MPSFDLRDCKVGNTARLYKPTIHYSDVIMTTMASQITSLTVVYSTVYSYADQRKHQSSASLAFVWEIHRDRLPVTRKMFPFDDVIMWQTAYLTIRHLRYLRDTIQYFICIRSEKILTHWWSHAVSAGGERELFTNEEHGKWSKLKSSS